MTTLPWMSSTPNPMYPNTGMQAPAVKQPSMLDRVMGGLLPNSNPGGMLSDDELKAARQQAMLAMGAQLLQASGPSQQPIGLGQALGSAVMAGQGTLQQSQESALKSMLLKKQMEKLSQGDPPSSVREYEYAKKNGFEGSFQEWIVAGGQSSRPSSVQEWEHYSALLEEDKKNGTNKAQLYLEMKRNPNFTIQKINEVPTGVLQSVAHGTSATPLSTLGQTTAAAEELKRAEGRGGAYGKTEGEIAGGIQKKGSEAVAGGNILDIAEPLIDVATGSAAGSARDKVAAFFGEATTGAEAIGKLQVLQAALMMNQPRMEGPQGEKDVELYQKAAGQIGDPTVPGPIKKAAMQTIRQLQEKYKARAAQQIGTGTAPSAAIDHLRQNPHLKDAFRAKYGYVPDGI